MWQSRPVFISSTFVDMQAERDYLRTRVFPELEERLRTRRHNLEWVDLRVGVATASQRDERVRELHVLKVCLEEVRRCRPFLIVLLGDRYGWVPPEDRIKAAAEEARHGFSANVAGRSVTDLEIEFGILSDPAQQPRSFFYFREPLPYGDMPGEIAALYCEDYAADAARGDRRARLAALKRRIEQQLPARIRHYAAKWDIENNRVTALDDFGRMVLNDIWSQLDVETGKFAAAVDIPWQQAERDALEDFIDDRARDFVGRHGILDSLLDLATTAAKAGATWGACVTGAPGSGKSALFGELYRRLRGSDVFLLAHAAGASVNATSVDPMLRRWIGEIAEALGTDPVLAENADQETIDATFSSFLGQMAQRRRVVMVIDALDQLETTTRAQHLTWLPRLWAKNARLIATAISGTASQALGERAGTMLVPLAPLDAAEARDIADGICRRYHRTFEPDVIEALLAKSGPNGPAWGNPLWLVLAVEELNLLDADDFARAQRDYAGEPAERLRALMLDSVAGFPANIPGLYAHTFARAEELFGADVARAFLGLIAVGRGGWRENDFRILLPRASGQSWDELKFAQLRRIFRGQMRLRGALAQWDFSHTQMRAAVRARLAAWRIREQNLHAMIADRLLSSPLEDPLRVSETMVHLLGSEDWGRAAGYYGAPSLASGEEVAATQVLAQFALNDPIELKVVLSVLSTPGSDLDTLRIVTSRYLRALLPALEGRAGARTKEALALVIRVALDKLHQQYPENLMLFYELVLASITLGDCGLTLGDLARAQRFYREAREVAESLNPPNIKDAEFQLAVANSLVLALHKLGRIAWLQGDLEGAGEAYRRSLSVAIENSNRRPGDLRLRDSVAVSYEKLAAEVQVARGQLSTAETSLKAAFALRKSLVTHEPKDTHSQRNLGVCHMLLGDVQNADGNHEAAELNYRACIGIFEQLANRDPTNADWQRDLSVSHERLGDELIERDDLPRAEAAYTSALAIATRLAEQEPGNTGWLRDLAVAHRKIGYARQRRADLGEAEASYRASLTIVRRLAALDSTNAQWLRDVGVSLNDLGDIQLAQDDVHEAANSFAEAMTISERLARENPEDTEWQRSLGISYGRLAKIRMKLKEFDRAEELYRASLAISERLTRKDPDNTTWRSDLAAIRQRIAEVTQAKADSEAAGSKSSS